MKECAANEICDQFRCVAIHIQAHASSSDSIFCLHSSVQCDRVQHGGHNSILVSTDCIQSQLLCWSNDRPAINISDHKSIETTNSIVVIRCFYFGVCLMFNIFPRAIRAVSWAGAFFFVNVFAIFLIRSFCHLFSIDLSFLFTRKFFFIDDDDTTRLWLIQ